MMVTDELIERFLQQRCSAEEARAVWQYFQANPGEMDRLLSKTEWDHATQGKKDAMLSAEMLKQIRQQTYVVSENHKKAPVLSLRRWAAAAVILVIAGSGAWFALQQKTAIRQLAKEDHILPQPVQNGLVRTNTTAKEMKLDLPDGSTVLLAGNSTLRYDSSGRDIRLNGEAFFDVAKHPDRPFQVRSGTITTTVLGTSFRVTAFYTRDSRISVQLFTGKVLVKSEAKEWKKDVTLAPGQLLVYDTSDGDLAVERFQQVEKTGNQRVAAHAGSVREEKDALVFDNVPFREVVTQLEKKYGAQIQYDRAATSDIYFSGTVSAADSLGVVLNTIARMNGLEVHEQQGIYIVRVRK